MLPGNDALFVAVGVFIDVLFTRRALHAGAGRENWTLRVFGNFSLKVFGREFHAAEVNLIHILNNHTTHTAHLFMLVY